MPTSYVAVTQGGFRFTLDALMAAVGQRWPDAPFKPATGRLATVSLGQFEIPSSDAFPVHVLLSVDVEGESLTVESPVQDRMAQAIALATELPGFPLDGSVLLAEWSREMRPLQPHMTREQVLDLAAPGA